MGSSGSPLSLNTWEVNALSYGFPTSAGSNTDPESAAADTWRQLPDPIIYPGLYSASGFDVMAVLLQVMSRPNPTIELGAIDCSVSLVLCDLDIPDYPIVYVSDAFSDLTGYTSREAVGKNCRFLQKAPKSKSKSSEKSVVKEMRHSIYEGLEIQVEVVNYKKNGKKFNNFLSIVPLGPNASGHRYAVGFQVEI